MMPDPEDSVELSGADASRGSGVGPEGSAGQGAGRPFLRLWFRCANQYGRAYLNPDGTGYTGRCAKCAQSMRFKIGPGGTSERFFEVSCR